LLLFEQIPQLLDVKKSVFWCLFVDRVHLGDVEHVLKLVQGRLKFDQIVQVVPVTWLGHEAAQCLHVVLDNDQ